MSLSVFVGALFSKLISFDIVITSNDYVKHASDRIYVFFTLFGYRVRGAWVSQGMVHNLLMQVFTLDSSKIEIFETYFTCSSQFVRHRASFAMSPDMNCAHGIARILFVSGTSPLCHILVRLQGLWECLWRLICRTSLRSLMG